MATPPDINVESIAGNSVLAFFYLVYGIAVVVSMVLHTHSKCSAFGQPQRPGRHAADGLDGAALSPMLGTLGKLA